MLKKKGDTFLVTLLVVVLIGIFVLVQFTKNENVDRGIDETKEESAERALAAYADLVKKAVTDILVLAAKKASYDSATSSIDATGKYFIAYGQPVMPTLEEAKVSVSTRAREYGNQYLTQLSGAEYGNVEFRDSGAINEVKIWVND